MKLFHRPAHTISPTLHREAYSRGGRLRLVVIGALIGGLLTGGSTYAIARVNTQVARSHAKHRLEQWRAAQIQMAALHTVATHRHWCTRP